MLITIIYRIAKIAVLSIFLEIGWFFQFDSRNPVCIRWRFVIISNCFLYIFECVITVCSKIISTFEKIFVKVVCENHDIFILQSFRYPMISQMPIFVLAIFEKYIVFCFQIGDQFFLIRAIMFVCQISGNVFGVFD